MKATHNIKIDGRWYRAGNELPAEAEPVKVQKAQKTQKELEVPEAQKAPEAEAPTAEEPAKAPEKQTVSRRKKTTIK